jgi:hypothetical protein
MRRPLAWIVTLDEPEYGRAMKLRFHTACDCHPLAVRRGLQMFQRMHGIRHGIERQRRLMTRIPLAVGIVGVFFRQMGAVRQQQAAKLRGSRRTVHAPLVTAFHQQGR